MFTSSRAAQALGAAAHHSKHIVLARSAVLAAVAVATSGLLAACASPGTGQSDPSPAASVTGTHAQPPGTAGPASSSAAPSAVPSPVRSGAPSGVAGLAACRASSLAITVDDSQAGGGAGSSYYPLNFTNTSVSPCQLYGYPGVSFVTAGAGAGQQIGLAARRGRAFAKVTVRLAPGGTAHAWLQVTVAANYPASSCHPVTAHWLRVYPPGETAPAYLGHTFNACSSSSTPLLTVLPVRAGQGVQGITP